MSELTVVTGLWDIGRQDRSFDLYKKTFAELLTTNVNMVIYVPSELKDFVWSYRKKENTRIEIVELEDIKNNFFAEYWEPLQKIRNDDNWKNQANWLVNSAQSSLEWYAPIQMSKMFFVEDAVIKNHFNSNYIMWIDAGITLTVPKHYFTEDKILNKVVDFINPFLFLKYPYKAKNEIHGFSFKAMNEYSGTTVEYVCRGGFWGGKIDVLPSVIKMYNHFLKDSLSKGYMGAEENIFTIMSHLNKNIFKTFEIKQDGLIKTFAEYLKNYEKTKEDNYTLKETKKSFNTSLYVLSYNAPEQFQLFCEKLFKHEDWYAKPRKILINNSDDKSKSYAYNFLAKKHGFECIETNQNLGISGGREFVAKHFQESEQEYYIFFEDDMFLNDYTPGKICRNGFITHTDNLYEKIHEIIDFENLDFLKLSYTEYYMDNNIQVSWYNVSNEKRKEIWPNNYFVPFGKQAVDHPKTNFYYLNSLNGLSYGVGEVYYANWPMIMKKSGNKKIFLEVSNLPEHERMSMVFERQLNKEIVGGVLLGSFVFHYRKSLYPIRNRKEI